MGDRLQRKATVLRGFATFLVWFIAARVAYADTSLRLSGIVMGPGLRVAIVADRATGRTTAVLTEGARLGSLLVRTIEPHRAILVGPAGIEVLELEMAMGMERVQPLPLMAPAIAGSFRMGTMLGRLALQHDNCAREGLLPQATIDAEAQMRALVSRIAGVPHHEGEQGKFDAPVGSMSAAMIAGLEAARRQGAEHSLDRASCAGTEARWKYLGRRYGLR